MKPGRALFKTLALCSSLLLAGGYVWYRSGGSIPYIAPAKLQPPAPTSPSSNEVVVPQKILDQIKNDPTYLGGSKSDRVDFTPPRVNVPKVHTDGSAQKRLPEILLDQNYEIIDLEKRDPGERTILSGSKSSAMDFRRSTDQDTAKKLPDTGHFETVIVPTETTVNGKRVLLPGPKSAFPGIISDNKDPREPGVGLIQPKIPGLEPNQQKQKREEPKNLEASKPPQAQKIKVQMESPPAQTKREFLPGSKSSGFRERN